MLKGLQQQQQHRATLFGFPSHDGFPGKTHPRGAPSKKSEWPPAIKNHNEELHLCLGMFHHFSIEVWICMDLPSFSIIKIEDAHGLSIIFPWTTQAELSFLHSPAAFRPTRPAAVGVVAVQGLTYQGPGGFRCFKQRGVIIRFCKKHETPRNLSLLLLIIIGNNHW